MPHIQLPADLPGIIGPMVSYPDTEKPLNALAEALLRGPSTLTEGERELIATYVSSRNQCVFCATSHGATARHLLNGHGTLVEQVITDLDTAPVSEKLRKLLRIAGKVQISGREVTEDDIAAARQEGATDAEIHTTVLIAAAFCMYNRYVDGLATWTPNDPQIYDQIGEMLATQGYVNSVQPN